MTSENPGSAAGEASPSQQAPEQWRRSRALWLASLLLPAIALAASILLRPTLYNATIITPDIDPAVADPKALYQMNGTKVWFTSQDLLRPDAFPADAPRLDAVAVDIATDIGEESGILPTWLLQIGYLLALRDGDGAPLLGMTPGPADTELAQQFRTLMLDQSAIEAGDLLILEISQATLVGKMTGLRALLFLGVGGPSEGAESGLGDALREVQARLEELEIGALGLPCIGALDGTAACIAGDWTALFSTVDETLVGKLDTVVLGGWAKFPKFRVEKSEEFASAWTSWQREVVAPAAATITHQAPRLAAIALLASLITALARGAAFRRGRLIALVVLSGGSIGGAAKLVQAYLPLWSDMGVGRPYDLIVAIIVAILVGIFMPVLANYKASDHV